MVAGNHQEQPHPRAWYDKIPDGPHKDFFLSVNWADTLLGPLEKWDIALRLHTLAALATGHASCVYWGPERVAIYNEAFAPLAAEAHPKLMGQPFKVAFPEIWENIGPVFNLAEQTGIAAQINEMELFVRRSGYLEETYFNGNFTPLRDETLEIVGINNSTFEVTNIKLAERRTKLINEIAVLSPDMDSKQLGLEIIECLKKNPRDVPMAILYSADEDSKPGTCLLSLRGLVGIGPTHPLAIVETDLDSPDGIIPFLRKARMALWEPRTSRVVSMDVDARFDGVQWVGFGEPATSVSCAALSNGSRLFGFLLIGMNPRRAAKDDISLQFVRDLARQISATYGLAMRYEESRRREESIQESLSQSERQIRYLANHAGVGMQHLRLDGSTIWANDSYYQMTGHPKPSIEGPSASFARYSFIDILHPDDQYKAKEIWEQLITEGKQVSVEMRLKTMYTPPIGDPEPRTMLALAFPYWENGAVNSIMSCMTDISSLKFAENWQARQAQAARDAKQQQERFIDIVSHEMRNPLSAMFHCAESINSSAAKCLQDRTTIARYQEVLRASQDAAQQILVCANHQKRIIDDVLLLSRLESQMLSMAPAPLQLSKLVDGVVGMFQAESISHDIKTTIAPSQVLQKEGIDWVLADGSRMAQIMVNLLTNAIKFTKNEPKKEITIRYGVTRSNPKSAFHHDMQWAAQTPQTRKPDEHVDWGDEELYLTFSITDSGIGMEKQETRRLFDRFAQANAKTTIKYGGSGLGLFISRQLAEAHGGALGVLSTPNGGSTFAFFVRTARARAPPESPRSVASQDVDSVMSSLRPLGHRKLRKDSAAGKKYAQKLSKPFNVLIVEDNVINAKVLAKRLMDQGCTVYLAGHGVEALDMIRTSDLWHDTVPNPKPLDLILMDVEMPIMDGLTCSREIRRLQATGEITRHIQIIATTANARSEQLDSAVAAGMDSVLPKPFMIADLMTEMGQRMKID